MKTTKPKLSSSSRKNNPTTAQQTRHPQTRLDTTEPRTTRQRQAIINNSRSSSIKSSVHQSTIHQTIPTSRVTRSTHTFTRSNSSDFNSTLEHSAVSAAGSQNSQQTESSTTNSQSNVAKQVLSRYRDTAQNIPVNTFTNRTPNSIPSSPLRQSYDDDNPPTTLPTRPSATNTRHSANTTNSQFIHLTSVSHPSSGRSYADIILHDQQTAISPQSQSPASPASNLSMGNTATNFL
jgi:hypothetical protein